jgi:hypothetical protein
MAGRQGIFEFGLRLLAVVGRISPTLAVCAAWLASVFAAIRDCSLTSAAFSEAVSLDMSLAESVSQMIRIENPRQRSHS